jgi:NADPH-dependent 2,4-dienoyl-CoA reductase/sulfur reductase-like enzyme
VRHANIFSLGDASGLPTSKTGAAIRKQAPVCVANVISHLSGKALTASYNGYTSCPLVTGYGNWFWLNLTTTTNQWKPFHLIRAKNVGVCSF